MLKNFARRRMNEIDYDIRNLVNHQDTLTPGQEERLERLDRAHRFWQRYAG